LTRYFAAYEVTKKALTPPGQSPSQLNLGAIIMAGGTAGVAMWAVAIPPDVSSWNNQIFNILTIVSRS
jgi:solute carrier family 25 carnitine/acylcarnitine transporter 20/29